MSILLTETNYRNTMAKSPTTKERRRKMVKDFLRRTMQSSSGSISQKCWYYWSVNGKQSGSDDSGRHRGSREQYDGVDA